MSETSEIRKLRQAVINAKANLTESIYMLKRAETQVVLAAAASPDGWKLLGPNEEARKHSIVDLQDTDTACKRHRSDVRDAERTLAEAEAEVEAWLDVRRRERETITVKLADALALGSDIAEILR